MNRSLKKIRNAISSILVAPVVILALLVGARIVGLQVFTVLSGSMEPTYHTGSLIYVKKVDPYTIKEGQPITFTQVGKLEVVKQRSLFRFVEFLHTAESHL